MEQNKSLPIKKSSARLAAIQYLYTKLYDNNNQISPLTLVSMYENNELEANIELNHNYFNKLIEAINLNLTTARVMIEKYLNKRAFEEHDRLIQAILLAAVCEYLTIGNIPKKVLVSEYTNITAAFYLNSEETGFINAVLDKFFKDQQSE